jgi:hypothetical protein
MRIPIITTVGTLDVEIHFMPADPDSGFPEPYVDEMFLYYAGTDRTLSKADEDELDASDREYIKREYIKELNEQAALARALNRGQYNGT